jgi:hypothetical protein
MRVCFSDNAEMRGIVPGLLGRGEVTFRASHQVSNYYVVMAIEPDNQTGASE